MMNPVFGLTTPEQAQGLLFRQTTPCRSCGSTDTRKSTMPEAGESFPIRVCNKCSNWWGED